MNIQRGCVVCMHEVWVWLSHSPLTLRKGGLSLRAAERRMFLTPTCTNNNINTTKHSHVQCIITLRDLSLGDAFYSS